MAHFKTHENYMVHVSNMDYTAIQNAKYAAMDNNDMDALDAAYEAEQEWQEAQEPKKRVDVYSFIKARAKVQTTNLMI